MNYTWPGRLHLVWRRGGELYATLWLFGFRLHWKRREAVEELRGWP